MRAISEIISRRTLPTITTSKPLNDRYEKAREFGEYVNLPPVFVLRLFKQFGEDRVLSCRSWLKDLPRDNKPPFGLIYWKLKSLSNLTNK